MRGVVTGALAGLAATAPMTAVMRAAQRRLPHPEKYPLPPEELPHAVAARAGAPPESHDLLARGGWLVPHALYGAGTGALYGTLPATTRGAVNGAAFGLAVWAVGYLGWIPALRLPQAAPDEPPGRNAMMIAAHLVWGASTGLICEAVSPEDDRSRR
jgi:hypothetical protein